MSRTEAKGKIPAWEDLRPPVTDELLADITRRIVEAFKPEKVVLFGSYAYGKPHKDSDLDLMVIMDSDVRPVERSRQVRSVLSVRLPMDILVRTPSEIRQRLDIGDHFIREILERGRTLYDHDPD